MMFETMTYEKAYFLGFFSADGCNEGRSLKMELQDRDEYILRYFNTLFVVDGYNTLYKSRSRVIECSDGDHYYSHLRIYGVQLCRELTSLGLPKNKTHTIQLPDVPDEFMPSYLRGVFDGDGNIRERRKNLEIEITSASESFLYDLMTWIATHTDISFKTISKHDSTYRIQFYSQDTIKLCKLMYQDGCYMHLTRKKDIYDSFSFVPDERWWTEAEVSYLTYNYKPKVRGLLKDIGEILGRSNKAVDKKVRELGLRQ